MMHKLHIEIAALAALVGLAFTGCAVEPDFRIPEAPNATEYRTTALVRPETAHVSVADGAAQRIVPGQDIPAAQWWTLFHSAALEQLVAPGAGGQPE